MFYITAKNIFEIAQKKALQINRKPLFLCFIVLVGARRFECARGAQASLEGCFTRLRRAPTP